MSKISPHEAGGGKVVSLKSRPAAPGRSGLAAARRRLHDISRLIADGVWETDLNHRLTFVSHQVFDDLGLRQHELLGQRLSDIGSVISMRQPTVNIEGHSPFRDILFEFYDGRGGHRLVALNGLPIYDQETGKFEGMQGTARDVAENNRAEKEVSELFSAVDDSILMVMIVGTSGEIEYVNAKVLEATGYTMPEFRGNTPRLLVPKGTSVSSFEEKWGVVEAGSDWRGECHYQKKNGDTFWVNEFVSPLRTVKGVVTHYLWVAEDTGAQNFFRRQPDDDVSAGLQERLKKVVSVMLSGSYFTPPPLVGDPANSADGQQSDPDNSLSDDNPIAHFSKRQREVLSLMVRGYSNKEIGRELEVYDTTVKTHVKVICEKLGAANRTQAAVLAVRLGWS
jgi:PAS domain S-box-containing protein